MNLKKFYDSIRDKIPLTGKNVSGFDFILKEAEDRKVPLWSLAYILATVYHETAATMQPIAEYGKGRGKKYGKPGKYSKAPYGRGYVQLTWDYNYEHADKELNLKGELLKDFDLALKPEIAVQILFEGMKEGWFTGKSLRDYIDNVDEADKEDLREFANARKVINGTDQQIKIGQYALVFEQGLKDGEYLLKATEKPVEAIPVIPNVVQPETPKASVRPSNGILQAILAIIKAVFSRR